MNILFLAHRIPYPPKKGDKIRSFHEIRCLAERHQIALVCLADDKDDLPYAAMLEPYCQSVDVVYLAPWLAKLRSLCYLPTHRPLSLPYFYSRRLQQLVNHKLRAEPFDVVLVYSSSMAQYVEHVHNLPRVMDFVDLDSDKWAQYAKHTTFPYACVYRVESRRLRTYEAVIARSFEHSLLVSPNEVADFQHMVSVEAPISAISNGIDIEQFQPAAEPYDPHRLVFTGAMDYFANVETMLYFVREILPLIQRVIPDVTLHVVGSKPTAEIRRLAQSHANIVVTGFVEDIQPYVLQSAVFVAPMRIGRGINNKILEAMAMGVPVVTSSIGFAGIPGTAGQDLFVEDQPEAFAQQVIRLMQDPALRQQLAVRGRQVVEAQSDWKTNIEQLETILQDVVQAFAQKR